MKIKQRTLTDILKVAEAFYPSEIGGLLLGDEVIDNYVLIPGRYTPRSVSVKLNQLPIYVKKKGTFHSHPSSNASPSRADEAFFSKMGRYHLILAKPYNKESVKAYNNRGEETKLEIVNEE